MNLLTTLVQNVQDSVNSKLNPNPYRKAVSSALMSVAATYPDYHGIGFDEHFMDNEAALIMKAFLAGSAAPTAESLTAAWCTQYSFSETGAEKAIFNIMPMVSDFLYVLTSEASCIPTVEQSRGTSMKAYPVSTPEYTLEAI